MNSIRKTALALATSIVLAGTANSADLNIVDTAVSAGNFSTLAAALGAAGLVDTLKGEGPFTVFAPTDAAFAKLPAGTVEDLRSQRTTTSWSPSSYHVVPGLLKPPCRD
jgi:uncharacterized surface protein with fasciclin (FAS1) repeats